jgi:hypothetical protein
MKRRHFPFWYERINGGVKVKYVSLLCSAAVILFLLCLTVFADENQDQQAAPAAPQAVTAPATAPAAPAAPAVTGTASVSFLNEYIFRGYQLGRDSFITQPSLSASYQGFSVSFWGNIDSEEKATQNFAPDSPGHMSFNETDLTLSYTYTAGKWGLTGGWIYYGDRYANETEELFGSVSYDSFLKPTLAIYRDIMAYPGWYMNLSVGHSFKIYQEVTLDLGASAGYQIGTGNYWDTYQASTGGYTGSKYSAFHDGMLKAGLTIPVTKQVVIQPLLAYWFPLSSDARRRIDGNPFNPSGYLKDLWQGGVTVSYNF